MGKNPWDEDPDVAALHSASRGPSRWGRILVGLLLLGAFTFIAAYWFPLFRAHEMLTKEHRRVLDKSQELERTLSAAKKELAVVTARRDALQAESSQREASKSDASAEVESLKGTLEAKLDKLVKKGLAGVAIVDAKVVIGLADAALLAPKKLEVSGQGKQLLCDVAKAVGPRPLWVHAVDANEKPELPFSQKYPSAWALRAARAGSVAETLETKCGMKGTRLRSIGVGAPAPATPGLSVVLSPVHFELTVLPTPSAG